MKEKLEKFAKMSMETRNGYFTISYPKNTEIWTVSFPNHGHHIKNSDLEVALDTAISWLEGNRIPNPTGKYVIELPKRTPEEHNQQNENNEQFSFKS